jgi:LAO/AO transport system kinase
VALARLLSLVERGGGPSIEVARLAYASPPPYTVGITGAPGSGKSTLTSGILGVAPGGWRQSGDPAGIEPVSQVAVLAVDPSSPFSGGAILADRVRMQEHATDPSVFIRSMATRGHLGGLALAVPEAVRVLGAAGLPLVIVETVGVGQMEVEVASASDTTVVVVTPGWGDAMQASKAGLLEVADLFVVNKADRPGVNEARRDLQQMLDLSTTSDWRPPVLTTVASTGEGVEELWEAVGRHRAHLESTGALETRREARLAEELRRVLTAKVLEDVRALAAGTSFVDAVRAIVEGKLDPYRAAEDLLEVRRGKVSRSP